MEKIEKKSLIKALLPPSILSAVTLAIYFPSLYYPFQFDDIANISKRFSIRFDNPIARWWTNSRWFADWLNNINFTIGRFDPFYYRLFNVIFHILAGLCVFYLVRDLCRMLRNKPFFVPYAQSIAFASSALFLLHPVQTQTISYVIQARLEGIATFFVLATILAFVKLTQTKSVIAKVILGTIFIASAFVACGTKELVVIMPLLLLLVDWFFLSQEQWALFKKRLWFHSIFVAAFAYIIIHYLGSKFAFDALLLKFNTGNNRGNILTPNAFDIITPWQFFISEFRVIVHYILIFFWPFDISVEYDWKIAPSFWSLQVIIPFILLVALLTVIMQSIIKKQRTPITFGFLWFLLAIAPRSTIIPSPELVCDYKTYLASVGILFIIGYWLVYGCVNILELVERFLANVGRKIDSYQLRLATLTALSLVIGLAAYQRNKVWASCVDFWQDNALKAPNKARVHNNLGVALSEAGKIDEAIVAYQKAIALDTHYADPLSNLAVAYSLKGDTDKAIESLKGAIHICPNYPEAYNNMGTLLLQKKAYDDAFRALNIAIQLRPYYGKAYYNLARYYEEKGDLQASWEHLKKATEGDLDIPEVFFKLGQMSLKIQKYPEAIAALEKVIRLGAGQDQVYFNLANAYFMMGRHDQACAIYQRLVRDNPLDARYAYNLAETYFIKKDFVHAFEIFRKITGLPQPVPQAFFRSAHCLEQMGKVEEAKEFLTQLLTLNAADDFKKMVGGELTRITLQQKVNEGKGSIKLSELKQALALRNGNVPVKEASKKTSKKQS